MFLKCPCLCRILLQAGNSSMIAGKLHHVNIWNVTDLSQVLSHIVWTEWYIPKIHMLKTISNVTVFGDKSLG